jgi:acyl-CoA thioesterase
MDRQQLAEATARIMYGDDVAARHLGIEIATVAPGFARLTMHVRPEFVNGLDVCHGGYIFLLADTAFAYACNSHNQHTVAAGASIEFLAPARAGELLVAEACEQHREGRTGLYDVRVSAPDGRAIALFRGKSATLKGQFVDQDKTS